MSCSSGWQQITSSLSLPPRRASMMDRRHKTMPWFYMTSEFYLLRIWYALQKQRCIHSISASRHSQAAAHKLLFIRCVKFWRLLEQNLLLENREVCVWQAGQWCVVQGEFHRRKVWIGSWRMNWIWQRRQTISWQRYWHKQRHGYLQNVALSRNKFGIEAWVWTIRERCKSLEYIVKSPIGLCMDVS